MQMISRTNSLGLKFTITAVTNDSCWVVLGHKKNMVFPYSIDRIAQAWFNWQMRGQLIQDAFHFMNARECEFLISGTTPEEWKKLFAKEDE